MDINKLADGALDRGKVLGLMEAEIILLDYYIEKHEQLNSSESKLLGVLIDMIKDAELKMRKEIEEAK